MVQTDQLMDLLAARVPVTLILDIAVPPDADELYAAEGGKADWLLNVHRGAA
jgi:hypothetical protein